MSKLLTFTFRFLFGKTQTSYFKAIHIYSEVQNTKLGVGHILIQNKIIQKIFIKDSKGKNGVKIEMS